VLADPAGDLTHLGAVRRRGVPAGRDTGVDETPRRDATQHDQLDGTEHRHAVGKDESVDTAWHALEERLHTNPGRNRQQHRESRLRIVVIDDPANAVTAAVHALRCVGRPHGAMSGIHVACCGPDVGGIGIDHPGWRARYAGGIPERVVEALVLQRPERPWPTAQRLAAEIQVDEGERTHETEGGAVGVECLDCRARRGRGVVGKRDPAGHLLAQCGDLRALDHDRLGLIRCWQLTGADAVRDHENQLDTPAEQLTNPPG